MPAAWKPDSWRGKPILQVPTYPDQAPLEAVERDLRNFPPLVFVREVSDLKARLAGVAAGESFLLQGGDCAESFKEHKTDYIRDYFQLFLQMALILTFEGSSQVVKVGRVAGQFAKPRSSPTEKQGGVELPSYRGDIVNGPEFTPEARIPDPRRQLQAYRQSAATLNFLRALLDGGYASLDNAPRWELKFMEGTPVEERYDALAELNPEVEQAAMDLGASRFAALRLVTLPVMWPAIMSAAILIFTIVFDDFVLAFFTSGVDPQPLSVRIYSAIRFGIQPSINAVGTLMLVGSLALIAIALLIPRLFGRRGNSFDLFGG